MLSRILNPRHILRTSTYHATDLAQKLQRFFVLGDSMPKGIDCSGKPFPIHTRQSLECLRSRKLAYLLANNGILPGS
jgi:hypothetical protein